MVSRPAPSQRSLFHTPELSPEEVEVVSRIEELRAALRYQVVQTPRRWTARSWPSSMRPSDSV